MKGLKALAKKTKEGTTPLYYSIRENAVSSKPGVVMATIIIDGFPCREKTILAEKLAGYTGYPLVTLEWVANKIPFWEYGRQVWDYQPTESKIIDGFICESWHDSQEPINDNANIKSIAKVQNVLSRRDDLLYLWVANVKQIESRAGIIERLAKVSGIPLSVLDSEGIITWCPPGTWQHKVKKARGDNMVLYPRYIQKGF